MSITVTGNSLEVGMRALGCKGVQVAKSSHLWWPGCMPWCMAITRQKEHSILRVSFTGFKYQIIPEKRNPSKALKCQQHWESLCFISCTRENWFKNIHPEWEMTAIPKFIEIYTVFSYTLFHFILRRNRYYYYYHPIYRQKMRLRKVKWLAQS